MNREGEANVLRERRVVPLEELLRPGGPQTVTVEPPAQTPVVPPQNNAPAANTAAQPEAEPAAAPDNPFGDDAAAPATESTPPIPPQENPTPATPPQTPPASEDENPFG
jgi:hypothetical protein